MTPSEACRITLEWFERAPVNTPGELKLMGVLRDALDEDPPLTGFYDPAQF